jgi:hypothetical protein
MIYCNWNNDWLRQRLIQFDPVLYFKMPLP